MLVIEDDQQILNLLDDELTRSGCKVLVARGERELRRHLAAPEFDLVLLDLALDGAPYRGLELVREIRAARNVPIMVITGHAQPWDRVRALEMGIDEYITKPFLVREVLIRLERVLKLYNPGAPAVSRSAPIFVFSGLQLIPSVVRSIRQRGSLST